jgi:hypothetical protein
MGRWTPLVMGISRHPPAHGDWPPMVPGAMGVHLHAPTETLCDMPRNACPSVDPAGSAYRIGCGNRVCQVRVHGHGRSDIKRIRTSNAVDPDLQYRDNAGSSVLECLATPK